MLLDPFVAIGGLVVGFVVGLTGMGGGALMTPMLVLVFGVNPLAAISSDLAAAVVMKPVGAAVHARRGRVDGRLVRWLVAGSVPAAFVGAYLAQHLGRGGHGGLEIALGSTLLIASLALAVKWMLSRGRTTPEHATAQVLPMPTLVIGVVGGLIVGLSSVGSGSLMMVLLMLLYPQLSASRLVGTDLAQAIPLVAAAGLGHLLFGEIQLALTASLLVGSLPGVYLGARCSSRAPDQWIRPVLMLVLLVTGLKLVGVRSIVVGSVALVVLPVLLGLLSLPRATARPTNSS